MPGSESALGKMFRQIASRSLRAAASRHVLTFKPAKASSIRLLSTAVEKKGPASASSSDPSFGSALGDNVVEDDSVHLTGFGLVPVTNTMNFIETPKETLDGVQMV